MVFDLIDIIECNLKDTAFNSFDYKRLSISVITMAFRQEIVSYICPDWSRWEFYWRFEMWVLDNLESSPIMINGSMKLS
jgi:hypothetical protein